MDTNKQMETATFAGGCFWCTEAIFKRLKGVETVISGYIGGQREKPTYEQVTTGATGHAEAIRIIFDPDIISYEKLLDIFWHTHNPTTLNQQGADMGTQYRSSIFYHDPEQQKKALKSKADLEKEKMYDDPIVTEIASFTTFYPAEDYHQSYYDNNKYAPYCSFVIDPKISKLLKQYKKEVKEEYLES